MLATRTINGVQKTYYALCDTAQTGEYEDDILRFAWLTEEEAKTRNEKLRNLKDHEDLRWVPEHIEEEEHEDTPSLDMELYY